MQVTSYDMLFVLHGQVLANLRPKKDRIGDIPLSRRHSGGREHFWPLSKDSRMFQTRKGVEQGCWSGLGLLLKPLLRRWQWVVEMGDQGI